LPFYYDLNRVTATGASANTEVTHLFAVTAANQDIVGITGIYVTGRGSTAGGATVRGKTNAGTVASGGTAQTPALRHPRNPAAQSTWKNDGTTITAGTTLTGRISAGFAQTGGSGGWVAPEADAKIKMEPNGTNPIDFEVTSIAAGTTLPIDVTVEFSEG
jgi:hypothetical protein